MRLSRRQVLDCMSVVAVTLAIVLVAFIRNPDTLHWFVIPICICGFLTGMDAIKALRFDRDLFDPEVVIGALSYHFFFLAPLLHIMWDMAELKWVPNPPDDWRIWLGYMGVINIFGIIAYRWCKALGFSIRGGGTSIRVSVRPRTLLVCLLPAIAISAAAEAYVLRRVGGLSRMLIVREIGATSLLRGMGWLLAVSEALPILCFMEVVLAKLVRAGSMTRRGSMSFWLLLLVPLQLVVGGLRGSRSNTVWTLFWAAGIIHYLWKPIQKRHLAIGLVGLIAFMYGYGFYKNLGVGVFDMLAYNVSREVIEEQTGRTMKGMILGDFGRANVQALLLYRQISSPEQATASWGAAFLADLAQFVPKILWPNRPAGRLQMGTDWLHGKGSYVPEHFVETRVYGLAGNAMFNFGFVSIPVFYGLWGLAVGRYRRYINRLETGDTAFVMVPLWTMLLFNVLLGDLDNLIVLAIAGGMMPYSAFVLARTLERKAGQRLR